MKTSESKFFGTYNALQVGTRGMQITLPSAYVKQNGIKPGTPMNLYLIEGTDLLVLQPQPKKSTD